MKGLIEKILNRLDAKKQYFQKFYEADGKTEEDEYINKATQLAFDDAKEIVQEVAEEYNNGWIPCSEMLPDDFMSMAYLTTVKGHLYPEINYYCVANHKWFSNEKTTKEAKVIAWMPLPVAFKERD